MFSLHVLWTDDVKVVTTDCIERKTNNAVLMRRPFFEYVL
jgi:hypothetical protein